ncbi:hypothetical protein GCM10010345_90720 [Streptomyces canarius]|uniref:Uncharacterized protein n=1 Tax=Streptomyces canarius TaxID=285453 RepID=A0ABQ3DE04_9ACTN|nr:hypothetical protein GCM10010345_90720 [Streptomyces canarius]
MRGAGGVGPGVGLDQPVRASLHIPLNSRARMRSAPRFQTIRRADNFPGRPAAAGLPYKLPYNLPTSLLYNLPLNLPCNLPPPSRPGTGTR